MSGEASAPQQVLSPAQLDDLELLGRGALGGAGYGTGANDLRLAVAPEVAEAASAAGELIAIDPEGAPIATLRVDGVAPEATGSSLIIGRLAGPVNREFGHFRRFHHDPTELSGLFDGDYDTVLFDRVPSANDITTLTANARPVLLLVRPNALGSQIGLMRAAIALSDTLPHAQVVALPIAADGVGRSALLTAAALNAYAPSGYRSFNDGPPDPRLAEIAASGRPSDDHAGVVLLFTGLSGSGKSTIARALHDLLLERTTRTITSLDGDVVRRNLSAGLGFSPADREMNIRRIGWVAAEIARHGGFALCSPIAPFAATRQDMRQMAADAGGTFVMVHVATPLEECERRDRKGMYARARAGEISDFTGISSPYEVPEDADLKVDTTGRTIDECVDEVAALLATRGLITFIDGSR